MELLLDEEKCMEIEDYVFEKVKQFINLGARIDYY